MPNIINLQVCDKSGADTIWTGRTDEQSDHYRASATKQQGPNEMTPISMVSSYSMNDELSKIEFSHYKILISVQ